MKTLANMLFGLALAGLLMLGAAPALAGFTPKCRAGAKAEKPTKASKTRTTKKPLAANKVSSKKDDGDGDGDRDSGGGDGQDDGGVYDDGDGVVTLFDVSER